MSWSGLRRREKMIARRLKIAALLRTPVWIYICGTGGGYSGIVTTNGDDWFLDDSKGGVIFFDPSDVVAMYKPPDETMSEPAVRTIN